MKPTISAHRISHVIEPASVRACPIADSTVITETSCGEPPARGESVPTHRTIPLGGIRAQGPIVRRFLGP
ncbi:hypothetical protein I550_3855 [Mycobacterium intracellulare 1956]|uniref:Uncharacterized protein n=1 Tax=Mycobacterium intracellulare 1956 TaxID=1299331 RepID=X8CKB2_MYCIT|nr:hypothetical protein I550_3855 [Mycobacterium intracellulare 1956]